MKKKHIKIAIIAGSLLIVLIAGYIIAPVHSVKVTGSSMEPTIKNNQRVFVHETTDIKKGDIVLIESKRLGGETGYLIKRVDGMGGDTIYITDDMVVLDDETTTIKAGTPYTLPDDFVFVVGDNPDYSSDSRQFGPIHIDTIKGKIIGH